MSKTDLIRKQNLISEISTFKNSVWNKKELPYEKK